ncbi:MAG: 7,8-didemethyl-8-hydroxy-5-deazariboflavin synthase subunit CofG [Methanosarcinales archaeon]|nr:MAG: 7,8-didemethyl-8-hydroxy-5-deazariboflavin synthase subunit CofG [Methanosarcinales archaeon]
MMNPDYVTFSKNVFIPVTNICRNKCHYCGFRRDPDSADAHLMTPDQVSVLLSKGASNNCAEALFTFGEPDELIHEALGKIGYSNFIEYVADLCRVAITHGSLPHTNAGTLSYDELRMLKPLNASMGLMLETIASVAVHKDSPSKAPEIRLRVITDAGRLRIPFTTGILVGIGESREDRINSLMAIRELHLRYEHIQEVIIQPFVPKPNTPMSNHKPPSTEEMQETIALARRILPLEVAIQVPPNLMPLHLSIPYGVSDLGGISPVTIDYINPDNEWPALEALGSCVRLRERLPIYPRFVLGNWYGAETEELISKYADEDGFRKC